MYAHWILVSITITVWQTPVSSSNAIKEKVISTFFKISPPSLELLTHSSSFLPQRISFHFILTPVTPWHWFFFSPSNSKMSQYLYLQTKQSHASLELLSHSYCSYFLFCFTSKFLERIFCTPLSSSCPTDSSTHRNPHYSTETFLSLRGLGSLCIK